MKIVTLMGSPRRKGNTATVLAHFEKLAASAHTVERINIVDHNIRPCLGCECCQKQLQASGCPQKDDTAALLAKMGESDLIIYATPLYCWDFSAQMKALIDRHYCLVKWQDGAVVNRLYPGRRAALLVTCGGEAADNADVIQTVFARQMEYVGWQAAGVFILPNCPVKGLPAARAAALAEEMAEELGCM